MNSSFLKKRNTSGRGRKRGVELSLVVKSPRRGIVVSVKRREFLTGIAAGSALAPWMAADGFTALQTARRTRRPAPHSVGKHTRIAISSWSFHNYFQSTREKGFNQPGSMLALLDFPEMIVDRYKVHNFEFVAPHFASTEATYLRELKTHLVRAQGRLVNIPVDIAEIDTAGGLSDPDVNVRDRAIEASKKWIDVAHNLGAGAVRCDPGKMDPADLTPTVASYETLAAYGKSKGVRVIIENHSGVGSEHPEELVKLFKQVGGDSIGALPDFGNFPDETTRERGLPLLFPFARVVCHAKGLEFDASGNETRYDFAGCIAIAKKAGYKGVYSIEYEGADDPYEGVQKVVNELEKYL
jgi:sugar phosphate isomerase/epimerase